MCTWQTLIPQCTRIIIKVMQCLINLPRQGISSEIKRIKFGYTNLNTTFLIQNTKKKENKSFISIDLNLKQYYSTKFVRRDEGKV